MNELKVQYLLLKWMEATKPLKGHEESARRQIIDLKRKIREEVKRESDTRCVHDEGIDGGIVIIKCPAWCKSEESVTDWFMYHHYIEPYYTYYSPTGRPFTRWYKPVKRHGEWYVYHSIGYDV